MLATIKGVSIQFEQEQDGRKDLVLSLASRACSSLRLSLGISVSGFGVREGVALDNRVLQFSHDLVILALTSMLAHPAHLVLALVMACLWGCLNQRMPWESSNGII